MLCVDGSAIVCFFIFENSRYITRLLTGKYVCDTCTRVREPNLVCVCVCVCVSVWVVGGCACVAYSRLNLVIEQRRRFMPLDERALDERDARHVSSTDFYMCCLEF
jgi:hypothetical protein